MPAAHVASASPRQDVPEPGQPTALLQSAPPRRKQRATLQSREQSRAGLLHPGASRPPRAVVQPIPTLARPHPHRSRPPRTPRLQGRAELNYRSVGPRPAGFRAWAPCPENKNTSCFRPLHVRYAAPQAKFCGLDTSKVPISLKFEGESCALAHPMEPDIAMHTCLGSTIMGRVIHWAAEIGF